MPERLNFEERTTLLKLARQSLINAANDRPAPPLPKDLPAALLEEGASFVTLTVSGRLRGCIGTLQAYQPLANDVRQRAAQQQWRIIAFQGYAQTRWMQSTSKSPD